jgi:hypothetical protein
MIYTERRREGGEEKKLEEPRKNELWRGGRFYTVFLPMELPKEKKLIFFWAVELNSVGNFRRYFLKFALKF